jgi:hypothetical protein
MYLTNHPVTLLSSATVQRRATLFRICLRLYAYTNLTLHHYICDVTLQGTPLAVAMFILGVFFTFLNYDMDRQRQQFRATNGEVRFFIFLFVFRLFVSRWCDSSSARRTAR